MIKWTIDGCSMAYQRLHIPDIYSFSASYLLAGLDWESTVQLDNKTTCQHVVVANLKVYIINTTDLFSLLDVLIQLIFLSLSLTKKGIDKS